MDQCAKTAMYINAPTLFGDDKDFVNNYCEPVQKDIKCMGTYKPCLKAFPRQIFNMVIHNTKKMVKTICGDDDARIEFLSHLACFDNSSIHLLPELSAMLTKGFSYVASQPVDDVIPNLCCGYYKVLDQAEVGLDRECLAKQGPATTKYFINLVKTVISDAADLLCGGYSSTQVCASKAPEIAAVFDQMLVFDGSVIPDMTPIVPAFEVISKMDAATNL